MFRATFNAQLMSQVSVANPPAKPLVLFDGDCHFCRRWIERWRDMTGDAVEFAPYQEAGARFSEIPADSFAQALHFIDTDGKVYRGAEAVFRSLGTVRPRWIWTYERLPGFAPVTETLYRFIARNRRLASFFTRMLWGNEVRRPTYFRTRDLFVRSLGAIYLHLSRSGSRSTASSVSRGFCQSAGISKVSASKPARTLSSFCPRFAG